MSFWHPWVLPAACAAAVSFALAYTLVERASSRDALTYSDLDFLVRATRTGAWPLHAVQGTSAICVGMLVAAAAGPHVQRPVARPVDVVVCVDTSGSMASTDIYPSRAVAARKAIAAVIEAAPANSRIGLVSFADHARELAAPTDARKAADALDKIPPPNGPTAMGDAIALAQRMLPPGHARAILLVTDGVNNTGTDPMREAQAAKAAGIRLYTLGIGTAHGIVPGTRDSAGTDEEALRAFARTTGGTYQHAAGANGMAAAIGDLYRAASLQRSSVDLSLSCAIAGGLLLAVILLVRLGPGLGSKAPEL